MPNGHSPELRAAILEAIADGATYNAIRLEFGVGRSTIGKLAKAAGLSIARPAVPAHSEHAEYKPGCRCGCPSPEEIAARAAEVRRGWSEETRIERYVGGPGFLYSRTG